MKLPISSLDSCSQQQDTKNICLAVLPKSFLKKKQNIEMIQFPLYWIRYSGQDNLDENSFVSSSFLSSDLGKILSEVLSDSLLDELLYALNNKRQNWISQWQEQGFQYFVERQFLPGVTDNLGRTVEEALALKGLNFLQVASGTGFLFNSSNKKSSTEIEEEGKYKLYHPLTDRLKVHDLSNLSTELVQSQFLDFPAVHLPKSPDISYINLDLDEIGLLQLSRERLLALNYEEMRAIKFHFDKVAIGEHRKKSGLSNYPSDLELEIIAQTWSEHCKHKIFSAKVRHTEKVLREDDKEARIVKTEEINSLYKTYIQAPTYELMEKRKDLLSVFEDNSGVVQFNKNWAVCFKVETHNSPSALEPYGGALTGILGVNRDILGTGMGAKPIFNTDIFCFAYPSNELVKRPKLLPAETIIQGVRKGVQDGGNKSGIPTVNGAVYFHPGYRAKPLVYCGTGGILPLKIADNNSAIEKHTLAGDTIVMIGGKVGKDGIHGATFSSEALHEGSPVTAVQIGDPFTQKRMIDFVLAARDQGLITGITDNGAGGLSSSVGEMARITGGAHLVLDNIPLKYPGLADYEIVISESQERMTVSTRKFDELKLLADKFKVELTDIGKFTSDGYFKISRQEKIIGMLELNFLHKGNPNLELESEWTEIQRSKPIKLKDRSNAELKKLLLDLLAHPNICSREFIIRQYDHEVQGTSVIKPLMGPYQKAASDAAVIKPLFDSEEGLVVSNGICPLISEFDPELMAICAVDEAVRNAICVGADLESIVLLDNFCWPDPVPSSRNENAKLKMAQLVKACQGLAKITKIYGTPLISGKDSMKNDFDDGVVRLSIPPTLLVSAMGKISNSEKSMTIDFKQAGDLIYVVAAASLGLSAAIVAEFLSDEKLLGSLPSIDAILAAHMYKLINKAINEELISSLHDVSDGGIGVALSECTIGSGLGAVIQTNALKESAAICINSEDPLNKELMTRIDFALFAEGPARILITVSPENKLAFEKCMTGIACIKIGQVTKESDLAFKDDAGALVFSVSVQDLLTAWERALPFE